MGPDRSLSPQEMVLRRGLHWAAVVLLTLNLVLSTARAAAHPQAYVPGVAVTVLGVLWGLVAWAAVACRRTGSAAAPIAGALAVSCLALLAHPATSGQRPVAYPPLLHVLGAGLCTSPLVAIRLSVVLIPLFAGFVGYLRTPVLGAWHAAGESSLLAVSAFVAAGTVVALQRATRSVVDSVAETRLVGERSLLAARRAYERERWNGLVHDKVLGALHAAVRGDAGAVPAAARRLAGQALSALAGDALRAGDSFADVVRGHGEMLGLDVAVEVRGGGVDLEVHQVLVQATEEALTNVARHSGTAAATVVAVRDPRHATITIRDHGRGFDPGERADRVGGLSLLVARMRAVGGDATITSTPGRGTTVRLTWAAPPEVTPSHWQLHTFAPIMAVGAMVLLLNVVMGAPQWLAARSLATSVAGIAGIVTVTVVAAYLDPRGRRWVGPSAAAVALSAVLAVNIAADSSRDWRYWFLGALTPAVGAISFRYRPWAGLGTALAMTATVSGVDALAGRSPWAVLAGPVPVLIGIGIAGHLIRAAMNDAWRRVEAAQAERARLRVATAVEEERYREAAARVAALADAVRPGLQRILSGTGLTPEERSQLRVLEGAVRDHLAQPDLLDARLVTALRDSRARGVRVVIAPTSQRPERPTDGGAKTADYRLLLVEVLDHVGAGSKVRAVWHGGGAGVRGTISAVTSRAPDLERRLVGLDGRLADPDLVRISADEDTVLVQVTAPPHHADHGVPVGLAPLEPTASP